MRRMALATRVACDKEGDGDGYKSNGNKGDKRVMATRAMVTTMATAKVTTWVMLMVTRMAGNKEGKGEGGKGNGDDDEGGARAMERARAARQWRRRQGWRASGRRRRRKGRWRQRQDQGAQGVAITHLCAPHDNDPRPPP
jgi:hypothetical protein